jgi:uncharacterized damage-inducible protein DinB
MSLTIAATDLVRWNDLTTSQWNVFLSAHPEILSLHCDIRNSQTVAQLLQHIVAVELRYAQRLAAQPESSYADVPFHSPDALLATHTRGLDLIQTLLADVSYDWSTEIDFETISAGRLRASHTTVLLHLLFHSIRHYAQLASLVRSQGFKPDFPMDYLFTGARSVDA